VAEKVANGKKLEMSGTFVVDEEVTVQRKSIHAKVPSRFREAKGGALSVHAHRPCKNTIVMPPWLPSFHKPDVSLTPPFKDALNLASEELPARHFYLTEGSEEPETRWYRHKVGQRLGAAALRLQAKVMRAKTEAMRRRSLAVEIANKEEADSVKYLRKEPTRVTMTEVAAVLLPFNNN
jgi:hypothetical protein